jgi:AcrR family transcriptional regulator
MPKQTFFNLPDDKKKLIIDTALEEFSKNSFESASLSRIVEKAGIAKGSMYQYFENKEELYSYLVQYASEQKLNFINETLKSGQSGFFKVYKDVIFAAARYDLSFPLHSSFLYKVGRDPRDPGFAKQIMESSRAFIKGLLDEAYRGGELREDVNLDFAAFIVSYVSVDVGDYIGTKYGFTYHDVLSSQKAELPVTEEQLEEVLNELIDFFKRGIGAVKPQ